MDKKNIILAALLLLFALLLYDRLTRSSVKRVDKLTYVTGKTTGAVKKEPSDISKIRADLFPPKRKQFRLANKRIFRPIASKAKAKSKKIPSTDKTSIKELLISPESIALEIGASSEVIVDSAMGAINILISPQGIVSGSGTTSPLTFTCENEGSASAAISDGKNSRSLQIVCRMRPEERRLADFIFLGFLAQEKAKTIFLSRVRDNEIFVVKKGDVIIKKSATITQNYVVKAITDDKIIISSADGKDVMEINLTENEPLRK